AVGAPAAVPAARGAHAAPLCPAGVWCFSELFFAKEPQDVTVSRKDPVVLDCQARGEAPITITWLKNGGKVSENERIYTLSNGSLYISEAEGKKGEPSDEGFYQCLALNKHGAILSQKSHLTLASKCSSPAGQRLPPAHGRLLCRSRI
uniref:Ig-like domain-containing protein n=1 Tax=Dromaius novaehollandiae TaxID=8790 RepID=A0A8C4KSK6_DRONO